MEQVKCPHCGTWNPGDREKCENCHKTLQEKEHQVTEEEQREEAKEPPIQVEPDEAETKKAGKRLGIVGMFVFFIVACIIAIFAFYAGL